MFTPNHIKSIGFAAEPSRLTKTKSTQRSLRVGLRVSCLPLVHSEIQIIRYQLRRAVCGNRYDLRLAVVIQDVYIFFVHALVLAGSFQTKWQFWLGF